MIRRGGRKTTAGRWFVGLLLGFGLAVVPISGQDFRGAVSGVVTDSSKAALPGVAVTVTNTGTNRAADTVTDGEGRYQVRYLNVGTYKVAAKLDGFKTAVRPTIEVQVGATVTVDLMLEVGAITETVQVVGEAPTLNTTTGVTGQVITSKQIADLPLADGTAYMLSRMAPGITEASDLHFSRPMDNANLGQVIANGVLGGNDFTMDGAPNIVSSRRIGYSPPSDAVAEFKVETNAFDAQSGNTAGATINVALKSGTNSLHGTGSFFNRDSSRSGNSIFSQKAGKGLDARSYSRYSGTAGGPIKRNKTFFMVSYEGLKDTTAEPRTLTVPTAKMRTGDFSELLSLGIQIYDPLTGTSNRTPFAGNIIPTNRLDPIALKVMSYYPLPNQAGKSDQTANFYTPQTRNYTYWGFLTRVDHNINNNNRVFANFYDNWRQEDRYNWAGQVGGFDVTRGYDYRSNLGFTGGYTSVLTNSLIADVRVSYSKFGEWEAPAQSFDPASLGFGASTVALFRGYQYIPRFDITGFDPIGSLRSNFGQGFDQPFYNLSAAPTLTWLWGAHSVKGGYEYRNQRWNKFDAGLMAGRYNFDGSYTRVNNSATRQQGMALAQFLLGIPTSGGNSYIDNNTTGDFRLVSHSFFVQDDWKVGRKLTFNLGLRYEIQPGMTEAQNRNLAGIDLAVASPIEATAKAVYALNPMPEIPASQFAVKGGVLFANGGTYATANKLEPRAGFSYLLNEKTVVRGGIGLFSYPWFFENINQMGFSQSTLLVSTDNSGASFIANLQNPFPSGLTAPPGSSLGLATSLGRDLVSSSTSLVQSDRKTPYYTRWQLGLQRDFGNGWSAEAVYIGSRGTNLPTRRDLNAVPQQYVSIDRGRNTTQESYLSASVPNPFAGLLPGTSFNGTTVPRSQLLKQYPEFGLLAIETYNGSSTYKAAQFKVEKRFSRGASLVATYTLSKMRDKTNYLNAFDAQPEDRVSPDDRPNRWTLAGIYEFPFGHTRKWGANWNGIVDTIFGGWQLTGNFQYQTGQPLTWGHIYYDATLNPADLVSNVGKTFAGKISGFDIPAWVTTGFYYADAQGVITDTRIALGTANARYFPSTIDGVRYPSLYLLDAGLNKNFSLPRNMKLQIRFEAINALNDQVLWTPDTSPRSATFGLFTSLRNNPRDIQLGVKLTF